MAIYRGSGGSVEGIIESNIVTVAITQGGTGARTATDARTNLGLGSAATASSADFATAAQGGLAASSVQPEDIGTAAAQNVSYFATASQGVKADSAVQPDDLGAVATSNSYDDLDDLPTLGTASAQDVGYFATAAQGALADSATQPDDLATVATTGAYSDLTGKPTVPTNLDSLTDVVITSASTDQLLKYNGTNWVNATVAGAGTVTSVDMSVPTGLSVSGNPVTSTGTLAVTYSAGYAIPTTAKQTEWDTAYTDRNKWDGGSTGLNASTGRTSLGLGTAATTAATDYATAAQGAKADSAYQPNTALTATTGEFTTGLINGTKFNKIGSGGEGGEFKLEKGATSTLSGDVTVDLYEQSLRIFDSAGTNKGAKLDISSCNASVGSTLLVDSNVKTINGSSIVGTGDLTVGVSDGDKGDITVSGSGATFTIDSGVVSYAKMLSTDWSNSKTTNGYLKLPSGLIIQWGQTGTISTNTAATVTLPLTFPTACLSAGATVNADADSAVPYTVYIVSTSTLRVWNTAAGGVYPSYWYAIGY